MKIEVAAALIGAERFPGYIDEYFEASDKIVWIFQIDNNEDAQHIAVEVEGGNFEEFSSHLWKLTLEPIIEDET